MFAALGIFDPWGNASGGAGGSSPGVTGSASGSSAVQQVQAIAAAAQAAAAAAQATAAQGATQAAIIAAAQAAAAREWRDVTGGIEGYQAYEPSIMERAGALLSPLTGIADSVATTASSALRSAAGTAGTLSIGALLGSGTTILIAGGILLLIVLAKK